MSTTTLTLTPEPANNAVLIEVAVTGLPGGYDAGLYTLTRTDLNGTAEVRRLEGQTLSSGALLLRDYEAALTGTVSYTSWTGLAGDTSVTQSVTLTGASDVLSAAVLPQYRASVYATVGFSGSREARSTVHQIIGRPDPLVAIGPMGLRTGRIEFLAPSLEQANAITSVYDLGEVVLLRFASAAAKDVYHTATNVSLEPDAAVPGFWKVGVEYVEVHAPSGALLGAVGWTFEDVAGMTFSQVKKTYATFADLAVGPNV